MAETFFQIKKALGLHGSAYSSVAVNPKQFRHDHFIIGIDTERVLESGFNGLNTKSGDLLVVPATGANANMTQWANSIYIIRHADQILKILDTGAQVFD